MTLARTAESESNDGARDRIGAYQDFLHDQPQNLLAHCDIQSVGAEAQLGSEAYEALRQLEVLRCVDSRHLQRLQFRSRCLRLLL